MCSGAQSQGIVGGGSDRPRDGPAAPQRHHQGKQAARRHPLWPKRKHVVYPQTMQKTVHRSKQHKQEWL